MNAQTAFQIKLVWPKTLQIDIDRVDLTLFWFGFIVSFMNIGFQIQMQHLCNA